MRQIRSDLWETRQDSPFPGLTTHAYLWTGGPDGNVLFYSTQTEADFAELQRLGGVAHQYLSHRDEAGPMLGRIAERFAARLHAPVAELLDIGWHAHIDIPIGGRHVDGNGIEAIPTPGHSPAAPATWCPAPTARATCSPATPSSWARTAAGRPATCPGSATPPSCGTACRCSAGCIPTW